MKLVTEGKENIIFNLMLQYQDLCGTIHYPEALYGEELHLQFQSLEELNQLIDMLLEFKIYILNEEDITEE